jgi:CubicO group peptidase (beta-lactamase class C family)
MRAVALALVALAGLACGCHGLDEPYKFRHTTVPEALDDGWPIASPEDVGLDPTILADIHDQLLREDRYFATLGFLVAKDGKLVFETYLRDPADRDHVQHLQSGTKSVTSLVFGMARDRGLVPDLDATLCSIVAPACDGLDPRKRDITLRHLLTMRSGLDFSNDVFSMELWVGRPSDPLRYILEKPLFAAPGEVFDYRDADPQLIAYALERLAGRRERDLAREWLFEPLGIRDVYWDVGTGGVTMAPHGLHLRPRDFAKLGQLALDGGAWKGNRLVSGDWIAASTGRQTESNLEDFGYGYYWWTVPEFGGFSAWGHGGQFALSIPSKRLLLVQVARPDGELHGSALADFVELVRPLVMAR